MQTGLDSLPERFAKIVACHGGRIAISAAGAEWTYAELDHRSHFIAAEILNQSGEMSKPIALLMEHGASLVAGILGALKAGRIYLALEPKQPRDRLAAVLAYSQAEILLADKSNLALANSFASERLRILEVAENLASSLPRATLPAISPEAGAWLMFTSGSTGAPKGVWQNHRGVIHHGDIYGELIRLSPDDRLSLLTPCSLAASATHLFGALLNGAALCPFPVGSQGVGRLAAWLHGQRISVVHSVPTVFRRLAQAARKNSFETVRLIRLGGEPVLRGDVEIFRRQCQDNCRLLHALSSTETGLISALMIDKQTTLPDRRVSVGLAVPDVDVLLLDERGEPVKSGGEGRIAIRSAHLSQGYWRQPDMTMKHFRADEGDSKRRIFISNDLGRSLADGSLEHLGRADQLVKICGHRVDLCEVEGALLATQRLQEAAVMIREDDSDERRLTAFIIPRAHADVSPQTLRRELRRQLPEHMIPHEFLMIKKLPQTSGGKIDRGALRLPPPAKKERLSRRQRPRDVLEKRLARTWESVLNVSPIGRTDDFFELGGTSLQSVEVLLHLEEYFGVSLPPSTLVEHSTIEKLATLLMDHAIIPSPTPLVKLRDGHRGRPLFLIHSGQGDVASYGLLTRRLPGRPIYGLQSVGLQGESWPLTRVPAMAQRYLKEILAQDPTGPYLLAGTCMGGMIAFELAQKLVQQGKRVGLLGLFDSQFPAPNREPQNWPRKIYLALRESAHQARRRLRWKIIRAAGLGRDRRLLPAYRRFVASMNARAIQSYHPATYPGEITMFISADSQFPNPDPRMIMKDFAEKACIINIPGNRAGLFLKPAVDELARQLQRVMKKGEGKI